MTESKQNQNHPQTKEYIPTQMEMWKFYWKFIKIDWYIIIGLNVQWLIESILHTRAPFLLLDIKNELLKMNSNNQNSFVLLVLEFIFTHIILQSFSFIQVKVTNRTSKMVQQNIQKQIIDHLFTLDVQFFEDNKTTSLHQIILQGSEQICKEIQYGRLFQKINQFIYFASRAYFIYVQNSFMFFSVGIVALICILLQQYFTKCKIKLEKMSDNICEFESFALDEILNNMLIIKTFCKEDKEKSNLDTIMHRNRDSRQQTLIYQQIINTIQSCSHEMMKIAVICHAIYYYFNHQQKQSYENSYEVNPMELSHQQILSRNLGEIISNTYCILFLVRDFISLLNKNTDDFYENRKKYIGKVMKLYKVSSQINETKSQHFQNQIDLQGELVFQNIFFRYPTSENQLSKNYKQSQEFNYRNLLSDNLDKKPILDSEFNQLDHTENFVLNDLTLKINQGECVGLVGVSGGGKSTIAKLIERYYDPQEGNILINGKNIKDIPLSLLRKNIGLVHQEPLFFDNDIEYNITYGCEGNYTQEQLNKVLQIAGVKEFIQDTNRFPEGVKTLIGTRGVKLSTGQKQRIAIARALITEPKILILDEATSALDAESESSFQKYIEQLQAYQKMIIIIITHRLSTVFNCNKIFVIQNGSVVEQGNHSHLINNSSVYANLFKCQFNQDSFYPQLIHSDSIETSDTII